MRTIMIHEVTKEVLAHMITDVEEGDTLTFDDCLASQWLYWPIINRLFPENKKIFFVSTDIVRCSSDRGDCSLTCEEALLRAEEGDTSGYMSWKEIREIQSEGGIIGGHSHTHCYSYGESLEEELKNFSKDIETMKKVMTKQLGCFFKLEYYARPYNKQQVVERRFLGKNVEIVGRERYDIRELMNKPGYNNVEYRKYKTN